MHFFGHVKVGSLVTALLYCNTLSDPVAMYITERLYILHCYMLVIRL